MFKNLNFKPALIYYFIFFSSEYIILKDVVSNLKTFFEINLIIVLQSLLFYNKMKMISIKYVKFNDFWPI